MIGILLMAYGSPNSLDEVEPYYTDIRHGRRPAPEETDDLKQRYLAIGGQSPLLEITRRQAKALDERLRSLGLHTRVYVGMKHWHPYIGQTLGEIKRDGASTLIAIPLAPHYSKISIGGYKDALLAAIDHYNLDGSIRLHFVDDWHLNSALLQTWQSLIMNAFSKFNRSGESHLLFTAHSLPERIVAEGDPYRDSLLETSDRLAEMLSVEEWSFAFQSAGHTRERWLGPDILERLRQLRQEGRSRVLVAPIGFVSEHLEILYDIDIEAMQLSKELGIQLRRTELPNDSPSLIEALASLVSEQLERTPSTARVN